MQLISVNVGLPRAVSFDGQTVSTGIFKAPVSGPVMLRRLNLEGDAQADLRVHGGVDKAVYVYPFEHYAFWAGELRRRDFSHGQFGENFTITGLLEDMVFIGDIFQIGAAQVQVTQPRTPCFKLGIRMGDARFPAHFAAANRTGFYVQVLREGRVEAGNVIELIDRAADSISVRDIFKLRLEGTHAEYAHALKLDALSAAWRMAFQKKLLNKETS
ncbi:MAG: MOSC domain-containing protein [Gammaproteobacteria bacterium]|nr:MOSC domain-containing protein [Gammaproteobacteria bacterium]